MKSDDLNSHSLDFDLVCFYLFFFSTACKGKYGDNAQVQIPSDFRKKMYVKFFRGLANKLVFTHTLKIKKKHPNYSTRGCIIDNIR